MLRDAAMVSGSLWLSMLSCRHVEVVLSRMLV